MTNLNIEQQRAVNTVYGPVLVLAGPGSGKTFTLTERIRHMIEDVRISPDEILVITFSKKAALEMQERFERLTADSSYRVYFGTFHAIFYNILRNHTEFDKDSILTEKYKHKLLRRVLEKLKIAVKDDAGLAEILENISAYKNADDKDLFINIKLESEKRDEFPAIYSEYIAACKNENKLDFDDMLYMCRDLLKKNKGLQRMYGKRYKYILVDEFQDINSVQYEVLDLLSGANGNVFAVGDDDQSIYGFRGARPELMKKFMEKKGCEIINLCRNYRSSEAVIKKAHILISNNELRIDKEQMPSKADAMDGMVTIDICNNALSEAEYVCERINEAKRNGVRPCDIAVIYRTVRCTELLKERMDMEGILYTLDIVSDNYYESEWAKDIVAYLRAATGDNSVKSLGRILNKPDRGLDRDIIEINSCNDKSYIKLKEDLKKISNMSSFAALNYIYKGMGYDQYISLRLSKRGYSEEKIMQVQKEMLNRSKMHENIREWLDYIDSIYEKNNEINDYENRVNMLTAHSSKGLEYDTVFVIGLQEGIFPHERASTKEEIEEERRLLYVAMTRAKRNLYVVGRGEYRHGKRISRFIGELTEG